MTVELNHTIVHATDARRSAEFLAGILGTPPEGRWGPFQPVTVDHGLALDYVDDPEPFTPQHYAFLVDDEDFDAAFGRIVDEGIAHWADPQQHQPGRINHADGGRGVYFEDPDGHLLELITVPYGGGPTSTTHDAFLAGWVTAERDGDVATTDRLLTDDFVAVGPVGFVLDKAAWLQRFADGLHYDGLDLTETTTRHLGDTAITTTRWNARGTARGHPMPEATRATIVSLRRDDWRLAGLHFSFIMGTPGAPGGPAPT